MATISMRELRDRLARFDVLQAAEKVLQDNPNVIPDLVRGQLYFGYDGDGLRLAPYRNKYYAQKKNQQNPAAGYGNPDLYATGQFYQGIMSEVTGGQVTTFSNDPKNDDLTDKYGDEIHKLSEESKEELVQFTLQPGLVQEFISQVKVGSTIR